MTRLDYLILAVLVALCLAASALMTVAVGYLFALGFAAAGVCS